jgi:hypothetical protein
MTPIKQILCIILCTRATIAFANVYGAIRGIVHDPQHRPVQERDGDAESEIVGLDEDHHHRRQRRIPVQRRARSATTR